MNRWHQHYLRGDYHNQDPKALYQAGLATVQEALDLIEDGDCLGLVPPTAAGPRCSWSTCTPSPPRLDKGVDCWNTITRYTYPVTSDPGLSGEVPPPHLLLRQMVGGGQGSGLYDHFPVDQHLYAQGIQACKPPNVFVAQVSEMDKHGYVHLSCDLIMTLENLYRADKIIFEVNARTPMVWGENAPARLHGRRALRGGRAHLPTPRSPIGEKEETIAGYVTEMMKDGDCIQLGFGGIPNAIGFHLMEKHDLGIHTEQIGTSMAHLMACGAVTNRYKSIDQGITVGSFISGDNFLYDFVDQHPRLTIRRSRYTNDPYVIARNDNVVSVNASPPD